MRQNTQWFPCQLKYFRVK
uniref:Uncharacterized protein n=1 Tax=Rhizophora mucronata TaxID=61149 RepID=A0A2P2NKZ4_RHIMU